MRFCDCCPFIPRESYYSVHSTSWYFAKSLVWQSKPLSPAAINMRLITALTAIIFGPKKLQAEKLKSIFLSQVVWVVEMVIREYLQLYNKVVIESHINNQLSIKLDTTRLPLSMISKLNHFMPQPYRVRKTNTICYAIYKPCSTRCSTWQRPFKEGKTREGRDWGSCFPSVVIPKTTFEITLNLVGRGIKVVYVVMIVPIIQLYIDGDMLWYCYFSK